MKWRGQTLSLTGPRGTAPSLTARRLVGHPATHGRAAEGLGARAGREALAQPIEALRWEEGGFPSPWQPGSHPKLRFSLASVTGAGRKGRARRVPAVAASGEDEGAERARPGLRVGAAPRAAGAAVASEPCGREGGGVGGELVRPDLGGEEGGGCQAGLSASAR